MKKIIPFLFLFVGCVPKGYIKDPNDVPATKKDIAGMEQLILQANQGLYNAIAQLMGKVPPQTPVTKPKNKK